MTPKNRKAQALIALLATSPNLRRSRPWLQDKLWSQSDSEHGGASLRQTLTAIRRVLNGPAEVLQSSRLDVSLNAESVRIDWTATGDSEQGDFLEGLEIDDPEFEDWLRTMRQGGKPDRIVRRPAADGGARWKIAIICEGGRDPDARVVRCSDVVTRMLREQGELEITDNPKDTSCDRLVALTIALLPGSANTAALRVTATDTQLNRQVWAESLVCPKDRPGEKPDVDMFGLAFRLQTELTRYMAQAKNLIDTDECPMLVLGAAIPRIFSFQPDELNMAARMLSDAMDSKNAAQFLGWQAQIAVINLIEQFTDAPDDCVESGKMLAAKAIELDPMNSVVLSTAANANVLLDRGDADAGAELAQLAVRVNPANPLAWWAFANVAVYSGKASEAVKSARIASRLAARTPLQFWCDFQLGLAALRSGDLATARRALETSASLAPHFRPPRRYLLAIYAYEREFSKAARMLVQLRKLEPGFSLDSFVNDPKYPVSLVRKETKMLRWSNFQDLTAVN